MSTTSGEAGPREPQQQASTSVIAVGVDGSEGSSAALTWAATEAALRHATLRVVRAWHPPTLAYDGLAYVDVPSSQQISESTEQATREQLRTVLGSDPAVHTEVVTVEGPPAKALLDATKDADLLVVGSRGRGTFGALLLGSVSTKVAQHAQTAVVIIRP